MTHKVTALALSVTLYPSLPLSSARSHLLSLADTPFSSLLLGIWRAAQSKHNCTQTLKIEARSWSHEVSQRPNHHLHCHHLWHNRSQPTIAAVNQPISAARQHLCQDCSA